MDTLFLICVPPSNKQWRVFTMSNRFKPSIQLSWIKHDGIISVWLNFVLFYANLLTKCNSYWVVRTEKAWNSGNVSCIHCWRMRAVNMDQNALRHIRQMEIFSYPSLHQTSQFNMSFCSFLSLKTIKHRLNRILLYLWRETHFVIKTYILFEPTDPNSLFLYILVYKSNAIQSEWITILQIITTQKKNKNCLIFSRHIGLLKQDTYFRNMTTAFLNIRKQPSVWFKMYVWLNLSITLYVCMYVQSCSNICTSSCLYTNNSNFKLYGSRNSKAVKRFPIIWPQLFVYVCLNQL